MGCGGSDVDRDKFTEYFVCGAILTIVLVGFAGIYSASRNMDSSRLEGKRSGLSNVERRYDINSDGKLDEDERRAYREGLESK
jgi:hypothetical protein